MKGIEQMAGHSRDAARGGNLCNRLHTLLRRMGRGQQKGCHRSQIDAAAVQNSRVSPLQRRLVISNRRTARSRHCHTCRVVLRRQEDMGSSEPLEARALPGRVRMCGRCCEISSGHDRLESLTWIWHAKSVCRLAVETLLPRDWPRSGQSAGGGLAVGGRGKSCRGESKQN